MTYIALIFFISKDYNYLMWYRMKSSYCYFMNRARYFILSCIWKNSWLNHIVSNNLKGMTTNILNYGVGNVIADLSQGLDEIFSVWLIKSWIQEMVPPFPFNPCPDCFYWIKKWSCYRQEKNSGSKTLYFNSEFFILMCCQVVQHNHFVL